GSDKSDKENARRIQNLGALFLFSERLSQIEPEIFGSILSGKRVPEGALSQSREKLSILGGCVSNDGYEARKHRGFYRGRFSRRSTHLSSDQASSMPHTSLPTNPAGSAPSRTRSLVMSVGIFDAFFGQAIHNPPSGLNTCTRPRNRFLRASNSVSKKTTTSKCSFSDGREQTVTPPGNLPSTSMNPLGACRIRSRLPSRMPNLLGNGVPE